jgi:hypothetical protein
VYLPARRRRTRRRTPRLYPPTAARGYGGEHQALRAWWKPHVDSGTVQCHAAVCLMPDRWITPGARWHLGHLPDRSGWTGPEHAKCNLSGGASRGNRQRDVTKSLSVTTPREGGQRRTVTRSREW